MYFLSHKKWLQQQPGRRNRCLTLLQNSLASVLHVVYCTYTLPQIFALLCMLTLSEPGGGLILAPPCDGRLLSSEGCRYELQTS